MVAITVDDERPMLNALTKAVKESPDITEVIEFSTPSAVLEWAASNQADVAFLDISMRGTTGLDLAQKLAALWQDCKYVFCTGYSEYAVNAFKLHASGYLMKPITAEAVQAELDHIKGEAAQKKLLTVQCFGNFEVFAHGRPLAFRRAMTKELFAFLVDRNGASVTSRQICACLWEDPAADDKHMNYLRQLFDDLRHALREAGAADVLVRNGGSYAVSTGRLNCDYYRYLNTGRPAFHGEYMTQYTWAEETCALLHRR